jgi:hypothetical protein
MSTHGRTVSSAAELVAAATDPAVVDIVVDTNLGDVPTFRLSPRQTLRGAGPNTTVRFAPAQDGVQLSSDNHVEGLELSTDVERRAVFNDTSVDRLGRLVLRDLRAVGVVQLLARDQVRSGHVEAENLDVVAADARGFRERPKGYGVEVIPGAFVLWNQQSDRAITITADLTGLSAGRAGAPVCGSGIFVSGAADDGGRLISGYREKDVEHEAAPEDLLQCGSEGDHVGSVAAGCTARYRPAL